MTITRKAQRQLAAERRLRTATWEQKNRLPKVLAILAGAAVLPTLLALLLWGIGR